MHQDPIICAEQHSDKHVVKMCVEYAQLLSTAQRCIDGEFWNGRTTNGRKIARYFHPDSAMNHTLYKATHINHPSSIWCRASVQNYQWLYDMWVSLCFEFERRYKKKHLSFVKLEYYLLMPPAAIPTDGFTEPTPAMGSHPHCIVEGDSITSYRNYYREAKRDFAVWSTRDIPEWWRER